MSPEGIGQRIHREALEGVEDRKTILHNLKVEHSLNQTLTKEMSRLLKLIPEARPVGGAIDTDTIEQGTFVTHTTHGNEPKDLFKRIVELNESRNESNERSKVLWEKLDAMDKKVA